MIFQKKFDIVPAKPEHHLPDCSAVDRLDGLDLRAEQTVARIEAREHHFFASSRLDLENITVTVILKIKNYSNYCIFELEI